MSDPQDSAPAPARRTAVIGDVGGHVEVLRALLEELGVGLEADGARGLDWARVAVDWPQDLRVVQVGDLIHRGPDSLGVLALVDTLLERGVWTQVVGNHEQLYVQQPVFRWDEVLPPAGERMLQRWWADGQLRPGAGVEGPDGDWLVTHAGLTHGFWERTLGAPTTVGAALEALDRAREDGTLWRPGQMLTGTPDPAAGPVWASAGTEVYPSWLDAGSLPFHQAHGHSSALHWQSGHWLAEAHVSAHAEVDADRRHLTLRIGEHRLVGVDPTHGTVAAPVHAPLVLAAR